MDSWKLHSRLLLAHITSDHENKSVLSIHQSMQWKPKWELIEVVVRWWWLKHSPESHFVRKSLQNEYKMAEIKELMPCRLALVCSFAHDISRLCRFPSFHLPFSSSLYPFTLSPHQLSVTQLSPSIICHRHRHCHCLLSNLYFLPWSSSLECSPFVSTVQPVRAKITTSFGFSLELGCQAYQFSQYCPCAFFLLSFCCHNGSASSTHRYQSQV